MKSITKGLGQLLPLRRDQAPTLGARELEVMKTFWQGCTLSAKQVLQSCPDSNLSLSTMQSTLERLHRKGLLHREKSGRNYLYSASISRSEMITQLLGDITDQIGDGQIAPVISGFMAFIDQETSEPVSENLRDAFNQLPVDSDD